MQEGYISFRTAHTFFRMGQHGPEGGSEQCNPFHFISDSKPNDPSICSLSILRGHLAESQKWNETEVRENLNVEGQGGKVDNRFELTNFGEELCYQYVNLRRPRRHPALPA